MAKNASKTMMAGAVVMSKVLERILTLEAEISCLWNHISVLSKSLYKLDPPKPKDPGAGTSLSAIIEENILQSDSGGQAVKKEWMAEKVPPVAERIGIVEEVVAKVEAEALEEELAGSGETSVVETEAKKGESVLGNSSDGGGSVIEIDTKILELRDRWSDENIVVDRSIVSLKRYKSETGIAMAPLGPKRIRVERGKFVPSRPYRFRSVVREGYGRRCRGGGIVPSVVWGGGRGRGNRERSTEIA